MALTPEDVVNKRFQATKFREGYDQDEVDDFLDEVVVELPNVEYDRPTQDAAALQQIAAAGGGRVFDLADADKVADAFAVKRVARLLEDRQELWHAPLLFGGVLAALFLEWVLRKRYRMV